MKTTATIQQLNEALSYINDKHFKGNVIYNREPEQNGRYVHFTLRVKDSSGPGARRGFHNRRKLVSACWHVHGELFEYLFTHFDNIVIVAGDKKMRDNYDNWQDWNIGSVYQPMYYSEACECE